MGDTARCPQRPRMASLAPPYPAGTLSSFFQSLIVLLSAPDQHKSRPPSQQVPSRSYNQGCCTSAPRQLASWGCYSRDDTVTFSSGVLSPDVFWFHISESYLHCRRLDLWHNGERLCTLGLTLSIMWDLLLLLRGWSCLNMCPAPQGVRLHVSSW